MPAAIHFPLFIRKIPIKVICIMFFDLILRCVTFQADFTNREQYNSIPLWKAVVVTPFFRNLVPEICLDHSKLLECSNLHMVKPCICFHWFSSFTARILTYWKEQEILKTDITTAYSVTTLGTVMYHKYNWWQTPLLSSTVHISSVTYSLNDGK